VLAVTLLTLAVVLIFTICTSAACLGIWASNLVLGALVPTSAAPGTVLIIMVSRAGEPFPRQGPLIVANTRAPNLRFPLLLLLVAVLVHWPPALLVCFAGATGTVIPGDVPPTRAFLVLFCVLSKDFS